MASFSNYSENGVLNMLFNGTPFEINGRYLALFKSASGLEDNTPNAQQEVQGGGYARMNIASNGGFVSAKDGQIATAGDLAFPVAGSDWGTITHTAVMDGSSGGNVLAWGPLLASRTIFDGDSIKVPAGALVISLD